MRQMEFKMERPGLVEPGQIVDVTEGVVAAYFYYTIEPAVAMSANYRSWQRLKSGQGKVIDVKQTPQGYYVAVSYTHLGYFRILRWNCGYPSYASGRGCRIPSVYPAGTDPFCFDRK